MSLYPTGLVREGTTGLPVKSPLSNCAGGGKLRPTDSGPAQRRRASGGVRYCGSPVTISYW